MNRTRTAPTPHRLNTEMSWFSIPLYLTPDNSFKGEAALGGKTIKLSSPYKVSGKHAKAFYFASSIGLKSGTAKFNITDYLEECKYNTSWRGKMAAVKIFEQLSSLAVSIEDGERKGTYNLIDMVEYNKVTGEVAVGFTQRYKDFLTATTSRFASIGNLMKLKSGNTVELAMFLQARGGGVDRYGKPKPVKEFTTLEVKTYFHWQEKSDKYVEVKVRQMLNTLKKEGYPAYRLKRSIWIKPFI